ncbi:hypothetical protein GCM10010236_51140 [Streptomyces eurythermus]|nr:hypothetical protein GCM10010236_51140 [Streptomyces eurythermus]
MRRARRTRRASRPRGPPPHDRARRPHVIVVLTGRQRWDTTGAHGNRAGGAPGFDRLAREGTLVEHATTPDPVCAPALVEGASPEIAPAPPVPQRSPGTLPRSVPWEGGYGAATSGSDADAAATPARRTVRFRAPAAPGAPPPASVLGASLSHRPPRGPAHRRLPRQRGIRRSWPHEAGGHGNGPGVFRDVRRLGQDL